MMDNWTIAHHVDDPDFDVIRHPIWKGLMMTLFIAVILLGLIGNCVVIAIVFKNSTMQTVTNIFIANLALSDIGLCLLSLPVQLYYQLTDHWIFGEVMCKIIFAAFAVPMYVSTLTILLIAIERYWLILYPLNKRMSKVIALVLVAAVVLVSAVLAIPVIMNTTLHIVLEPDLRIHRKYCIEQWTSTVSRKVYSTSMFLLQFCLPICITAGLYYRIYCRLKKRPRINQQRSRQTDHRQRTNKVLLAIVSVFIVCWLPWNIFSLITELDRELVRGAHYKFVDMLLKLFAMSSACINPFLYCWLNENFRKELDNIAVKLKLQPRRSNTNNDAPVPPAINVDYSPLAHSTIAPGPSSYAVSSRTSITRLSHSRLSTTCIDLDLARSVASMKFSNSSLDKDNHILLRKLSTGNLDKPSSNTQVSKLSTSSLDNHCANSHVPKLSTSSLDTECTEPQVRKLSTGSLDKECSNHTQVPNLSTGSLDADCNHSQVPRLSLVEPPKQYGNLLTVPM